MKVDIRNQLHKSSFWLSFLGIALVILHLQLPFLLFTSLNSFILHFLAWGAAIYLILQRRKVLLIGNTNLISSIVGTGLIILVLVRSWFIQGNTDVLFEISSLFSAVGLILLSSGIKSLLLFKRELVMVATP